MPDLRVVGGTDADPDVPPVWSAPDGAERVQRSALAMDLEHVVVIGTRRDGQLVLFSNINCVETTIGFMERAKKRLLSYADQATFLPKGDRQT